MTLDDVALDDRQVRLREEYDGGAGQGRLPPVRPVDEGDVGGGDELHVTGIALADDLRREAGLEGDGLGGRQVPGMEVAEEHGESMWSEGQWVKESNGM